MPEERNLTLRIVKQSLPATIHGASAQGEDPNQFIILINEGMTPEEQEYTFYMKCCISGTETTTTRRKTYHSLRRPAMKKQNRHWPGSRPENKNIFKIIPPGTLKGHIRGGPERRGQPCIYTADFSETGKDCRPYPKQSRKS